MLHHRLSALGCPLCVNSGHSLQRDPRRITSRQ